MNQYTAKLDNGEGGKTIFSAENATAALAMAMEWAAGGDWSEENSNHLGGVNVTVREVTDEDDEDCDTFFPARC